MNKDVTDDQRRQLAKTMKLKNYTDIPDAVIRRIIDFVRPSGVNGFDVRVSNMASAGWPGRGTAYVDGSAYHSNGNWFVVVSLAPRKHFPSSPKSIDRRPGYLPLPWFVSREEAAVYYLAHEIRHLQQAKTPARKLRDRVWGTRGRFSERDACAYAIRKVRQWRKLDKPAAAIEPAPLAAAVVAESKPDPAIAIQAKVAALTKRRKAWATKLKRAQTALKKIDRSLKYYQRRTAAGAQQQTLCLPGHGARLRTAIPSLVQQLPR